MNPIYDKSLSRCRSSLDLQPWLMGRGGLVRVARGWKGGNCGTPNSPFTLIRRLDRYFRNFSLLRQPLIFCSPQTWDSEIELKNLFETVGRNIEALRKEILHNRNQNYAVKKTWKRSSSRILLYINLSYLFI